MSRTILITGASRGIGRATALTFAREGWNVVIAAKTDIPHPKLKGTIHTVAEEVISFGGRALPIRVDVRDEAAVQQMAAEAAAHFGGIDVLVNNAGAIKLTGVEDTTVKQFDLMHAVNDRAVLLCTQACLPWLRQSDQAHIINMAPPINLDPQWLQGFAPYTCTKYAMTLLSLGMAREFAADGIAVNALWPKTLIATDALRYGAGGEAMMNRARKPAIVADAILHLAEQQGCSVTGQTLLDEDWLRQCGVDDMEQYRYASDRSELMRDLFL